MRAWRFLAVIVLVALFLPLLGCGDSAPGVSPTTGGANTAKPKDKDK